MVKFDQKYSNREFICRKGKKINFGIDFNNLKKWLLKIFVLHKFYVTAKFLRESFISKQLFKHNETKIIITKNIIYL